MVVVASRSEIDWIAVSTVITLTIDAGNIFSSPFFEASTLPLSPSNKIAYGLTSMLRSTVFCSSCICDSACA